MKTIFRNIHLYLGLAAGLVISIVCFTGAMLVFEKELQSMIYPERYRVATASTRVSIEAMIASLKKETPDVSAPSVKVYDAPDRSVEISYGEGKGKMTQAFMDPYTGRLIALSSQRNSFFSTMLSLHRWLLMEDTGKMIVGISTLIFLGILISGIILWWPENRRILVRSIKLRWNAGWKRTIHDLHIVVGFYTAILLFACAFTGLAWSFKWFNDGIYWITGSQSGPAQPPRSRISSNGVDVSLDRALEIARIRIPQAESYSIGSARKPDDPVRITIMPSDAAHEKASTQMFVDRYSGEVLELRRFEDQSLGQRVRSTFYPIHVGSIAGLPGRIILFIACIAGGTLPISGVILWINRLRKKRTVNSKALATPVWIQEPGNMLVPEEASKG